MLSAAAWGATPSLLTLFPCHTGVWTTAKRGTLAQGAQWGLVGLLSRLKWLEPKWLRR